MDIVCALLRNPGKVIRWDPQAGLHRHCVVVVITLALERFDLIGGLLAYF